MILDLYVLFAIALIAIWLVSFLAYVVISNRQRDIEDEILEVDQLLEEEARMEGES